MFERLRGFGDCRFQVFEVRKAGPERFPKLHGLLDVGGATVLELGELALGKLVFVLDRCALDLRALKTFPGREKTVLGGLERLQRVRPGGREGFESPDDDRQFAVKLGNLCPPGKGGLAAIFAGLAAADDALAANEFSSKRRNAKSQIGGFNAECGFEILRHGNSVKQSCSKSSPLALDGHAAGRPSDGAFRKNRIPGRLGIRQTAE